MSQAKVDKYKEYKKNKKKILKGEKRKKVMGSFILRLIGFAIIVGVLFLVCYKGLDMYKKYLNSRPDYSSTNFVVGDLCGINESETETEAETTAKETETTVTETTAAETTLAETAEAETTVEEVTEAASETVEEVTAE